MINIPQITGDVWLNSGPLTPADLEGKVVLVDFWAYSCVNCQRTLPYLRRWWRRYKNMDFLILGIHTPEFEFERDPENLEQAVEDLNIEWPVVMDSEYVNWENFANRYWPAEYLFDRNGKLVYRHLGEGEYAETERVIQDLIKDSAPGPDLPEIDANEHFHGGVCFAPTPETYCGYARGRLDNAEGFNLDMPFSYSSPKGLNKDSMALGGRFIAKPEYLESAERGATVFLNFRATEFNLVLKPVGATAKAVVTLNGKSLPESIRGRDVSPKGEVSIEKARMYNLINGDFRLEGILGVTAKEGDFQAYAFTFSGCVY